jgi:2'-5' RNA ligase
MMSDANPERAAVARSIAQDELERFRGLQQLRNHWTRRHSGPAYYWYLTFEDCAELHALAGRVRAGVPFPYYDFMPANSLHLTLDRVAFEAGIAPEQLHEVASAAARAALGGSPFDINIGGLGGTPGALGLSAFPRDPVHHLRNAVRAATLSVYPGAPVKDSAFHPHVALAYCNADVPAAEAIAAVERLSTLDAVTVSVRHVALVLLARRDRAYAWRSIARILL